MCTGGKPCGIFHMYTLCVVQVDFTWARPPPVWAAQPSSGHLWPAGVQETGPEGSWVARPSTELWTKFGWPQTLSTGLYTHSTKTSSVPLCCPRVFASSQSRCRGSCGLAMKGPIVMTGQQGRAKSTLGIITGNLPAFYVLRSGRLVLY